MDFKVSRGYRGRVLVEVKLDTNPDLLHGFETQLEEYQLAEKTDTSIYLVIDVGGPESRIPDLQERVRVASREGRRVPQVVYVDAMPKQPASKYRKRSEPD